MKIQTTLSQNIRSLSLAVLSLATAAHAADAPPESHVNAVLNLEFANEYVTPRGMIVTDKGLTFQPLALGLINIYKSDKPDNFVNSVTLIPGVWSDFCSSPTSKTGPTYKTTPTTEWVEIDPIGGVEFALAKRFKLDVTWTEFDMQVLNIATSMHLDSKISFDDSDYLKAFALHPYFEYWQELEGKATDADLPYTLGLPPRAGAQHPDPGSSYYFEVGIDPGYTFQKAYGIRLDTPCRVLLPDDRFYGDFYSSSSTVGLYELGVKATLPMNFMPGGYGHWSFHTGFRYMNMVDDNLYHLNAFNAPNTATRDTFQYYAGINIFF
ncbi:MAG TPA: hypothetical protein VH595_06410 [Verrucomicrobiae bacterium]|jgi:hypothetical protein|nr:hypothetical protein [Verrucomicrobiae bacterium]